MVDNQPAAEGLAVAGGRPPVGEEGRQPAVEGGKLLSLEGDRLPAVEGGSPLAQGRQGSGPAGTGAVGKQYQRRAITTHVVQIYIVRQWLTSVAQSQPYRWFHCGWLTEGWLTEGWLQ